jgi:hypothetical protein
MSKKKKHKDRMGTIGGTGQEREGRSERRDRVNEIKVHIKNCCVKQLTPLHSKIILTLHASVPGSHSTHSWTRGTSLDESPELPHEQCQG